MDEVVPYRLPDTRRTYRRYSDADKVKALTTLDLNGGNLLKTSVSLDIPIATLSQWRDGIVSKDVSDIRNEKRENLADICEQAAYEFIEQARATRAESKGTQAATGAAIFIDKMRLLREQSTVITSEQNSDKVAVAFSNLLKRKREQGIELPSDNELISLIESACKANNADVESVKARVLSAIDVE